MQEEDWQEAKALSQKWGFFIHSAPCSLLPAPYSLLHAPCSLCSWLTGWISLFPALHPLFLESQCLCLVSSYWAITWVQSYQVCFTSSSVTADPVTSAQSVFWMLPGAWTPWANTIYLPWPVWCLPAPTSSWPHQHWCGGASLAASLPRNWGLTGGSHLAGRS